MAIMKHWVFNSQETNRNSESSVVDEKTKWELYYPPFEAAVRAGVAGVMCSYNRIDGTYSCENDQTLKADLKEAMGFEGFIQSDWDATHSTGAASAGLDMEMPMDPDGNGYFFDEDKLAQLPAADIDDAVERILAAAIRSDLLYNASSHAGRQSARIGAAARPHAATAQCHLSPGVDCAGSDLSNAPAATADACCALCAQTVGCAAFTHAQYDATGAPIPTCYLKSACASTTACDTCTAGTAIPAPSPSPPGPPGNCTGLGGDTYASGGHKACCAGLTEQLIQIEGHPREQYICVAPAGACEPPAQDCLMANVTSDAHAALARSAAAASIVLLQNEGGVLPLRATRASSIAIVGAVANGSAFDPTSDQGHGTWNTGDYYSGGGSGHVTAGRLVTPMDGLTRRAAAAGIRAVANPTDDVNAAVDTVQGADVAVVVVGATCGEADDRKSLSVDHNGDALVAAVAATGKPTVVLMQVAGATLTPWRADVSAIAVLFLGGQETGSAWADVLFGDVVPSGKLPVAFPDSEADTIAPSTDSTVTYAEGLATSYRNTAVTPAFAFGHGLSFTTFGYELGESKPCAGAPTHLCVDARVNNTGAVAARTVAQLYVGFPDAAGQPAPLLKGFVKTAPIAPGGTVRVTFELTERDTSYYDVVSKGWVQVADVQLFLGGSSADIRDKRAGVATGVSLVEQA